MGVGEGRQRGGVSHCVAAAARARSGALRGGRSSERRAAPPVAAVISPQGRRAARGRRSKAPSSHCAHAPPQGRRLGPHPTAACPAGTPRSTSVRRRRTLSGPFSASRAAARTRRPRPRAAAAAAAGGRRWRAAAPLLATGRRVGAALRVRRYPWSAPERLRSTAGAGPGVGRAGQSAVGGQVARVPSRAAVPRAHACRVCRSGGGGRERVPMQ